MLVHGIGHTWRGWRPMLPLLERASTPRPNCELRYLKGLGHVPMSDDPELLAGAIADFALATPSTAPRATAPA